MGRNFLRGREGDRINAVLAAAGHNFKRLAQWLGDVLRLILIGVLVKNRFCTA